MLGVGGSARRVASLCAVLCLACAVPASAADNATAEALFREGRALFKAGDTDAACEKLEESLALERAPGTLLNLARCHTKQGRVASAWREYREAAALADLVQDRKRAAAANKLADQLAPRLSYIVIQAPPQSPAGMKVDHNGERLTKALLGARLPVDVGQHVVSVAAPNHKPWSRTLFLSTEGDTLEVAIPPLVAASLGQSLPPGGPLPESPDDPMTPNDDGGAGLVAAGVVVGGLGLAALATGGVLGVMTLGDADAAESDPALCPNRVCTPAGRERINAAESKATASTVLFGVGGAATVAGAILLAVGVSAGDNLDSAATKFWFTPAIAVDGSGLMFGGDF